MSGERTNPFDPARQDVEPVDLDSSEWTQQDEEQDQEAQRKAELTRQRLANLARGREEAAARAAAGIAPPPKTRGRPASRPQAAPMPREATPSTDPEIEEYERQIRAIETGEIKLTRDSHSGSGVPTTFDIPEQGKRPGWAYQWWPFKVMAQDVDASDLVEYARGGWIPVHPRDFPSKVPPGSRGRTIDIRGMRLFMRPQRLNDEAQLEAFQQAFEAKDARLRAAAAGDTGREFAPRDPRAGSITIEPLM